MPTNPYAAAPQNPYARPVPPAINNTRPTPPRPTPPALNNDVAIGSDTMNFLTRHLDSDKNGRLEGQDEARVAGEVGNNNGVFGTGETSAALNAGKAMLYGFQLAKNIADAVANKISGGDAWVSKEDMTISEGAKARLDDNNDGRVSREELAQGLHRGGLAINAKAIMTTDEAKARFSARPQPPAIVDRPMPPPVIDRPRPPAINNPYAPAPNTPPAPFYVSRTTTEVLNRFMAAFRPLKQTYDTTSMSKETYETAARRMIDQAVEELVRDTKASTIRERMNVIERLYQDTPMNQAQRDNAERLVGRDAIDQVMNGYYSSFNDAKAALKEVYDVLPMRVMDSAQYNAYEKQLLNKAVDNLKFGVFPSYTARLAALETLYGNSSMTASERDAIARELDRMEATRGGRY